MGKKELTLRELKIQAISERKEGRLVELPEKFFEKLHNLEKMLMDLLEEDKNDKERKERIDADMRKFLDLKLDLIKRREMKLADLAIEIVNKQNPEKNAVEESEKEFIRDMRKVIEKHRNETMSNEEVVEDKEETEEEVVEDEKETEEEVVEDKEETGEVVVEKEIGDYLLVKVLDTTPTFIGMDSKSYTLEKNDIIHLPKYNARLLMDAGKIERME